MQTEYDVIVIGGGPAGTCCASHLARQGFRILLLEGKQFPREHIGESLLAMSMPFLEALGVKQKLEATSFLHKAGSLFLWGQTEKVIPLTMPPPGYAFQVTRARFDYLLLDHAREQGVEIKQSAWARRLLHDTSRRIRGIQVEEANGQTYCVSCSYVVDASGLAQFVPRQLRLPIHLDGPKRIAISAYFRAAQRPAAPHENDIVSEACQDGWLWFIPLDRDTTSIGFVSDEYIGSKRPGQQLQRQIETSKLVKQLVHPAGISREARILHYTNHILGSPLWGKGYVVVGDSAAFVDPLFSTGVHGALYSASLAAAGLAAVLRNKIDEADVSGWYDSKVRKHYGRVNETVKLLYGIHYGRSQFWRERDLSAISEEEAERIAALLGSAGMTFFREAVRHGQLRLPDTLQPKLAEFSPPLRLTSALTDQRVRLAPAIDLAQDWIYAKGQLIRGIRLSHRRNRTPEVELPLDSFNARLILALDGQRQLAAILPEILQGSMTTNARKEETKARLFIGTLMQAGILCQEAKRN